MKYHLGRLLIQNFKSIGQEQIDLSGFQTAILDGPNGFGKTTIFDALELCFTGRIQRISASTAWKSTKAHSNHFLKGNPLAPTWIRLELVCDLPEKSFVIKVEIPAGISGAKASVKKYEDHISRYISKDWESTEWSGLTNKQLEAILDIKSISALFSVQHYISQEDTVRFLRDCDESQRHEALSHLFGTSDQTKEISIIERFKEELSNAKTVLKDKLANLTSILEQINIAGESADRQSPPSPSGFIEAVKMLGNESYATIVNAGATLESLRALVPILTEPEVYNNLRFNELIDTLSSSREQELMDILTIGSIANSSDLARLRRARHRWEINTKRLQRYKSTIDLVVKDNDEVENRLLQNIITYYSNSTVLRGIIESITASREQSTNSARIVERLQSHRAALLSSYKEFHDGQNHDNVACPFCGDVKDAKLEQLMSEYEEQETFFAKLGSSNSAAIIALKQRLKVEYLEPLVARIRRRIVKLQWLQDDKVSKFFQTKPADDTRFNKMSKVRDWLDESKIQYRDLIDNDLLTFADDYLARRQYLQQRINSAKRGIQSDVTVDTAEVRRHYLSLGISNEKEFLALNAEAIAADVLFVEYKMRNLQSKEIQRLKSELDRTRASLKKVAQKAEEVNAILKIYENNLKKYEVNVASTIAIPLYIYTSKVLQTRPDGSGIFLKTPASSTNEKNPYIRFCARKNDTHDAWCTMSSGQLAGLIISFALAMNRLYPSRLNTILIDDPVQSMDEVNMASIVQLFLHEFSDHQFIVSTHERSVSSYMSYKFTSQGQKVAHINMKERSAISG